MPVATLNELWNRAQWKTYPRFRAAAIRNGFENIQEIKRFFDAHVPHDQRKPNTLRMLPIYSHSTGAYQMDVLCPSEGSNEPYFLIFINVNSRKAYAYPMKTRNTGSIQAALHNFKQDCPDVQCVTSDRESGFLASTILQWMQENQIDYRTTHSEDHSVLGIIDRFMRTLRDLNGRERNITPQKMKQLLKEYNASPHRSLMIDGERKSPNEMTDADQRWLAEKKEREFNRNRRILKEGQHVRIVRRKVNVQTKKVRMKLSQDYYTIAGKSGNHWIVKARDGSTSIIPGHRIVPINDNEPGVPFAQTIKTGTRGNATSGVVTELLDHDKNNPERYRARWEGVKKPAEVFGKDIRAGSGKPTHMTPLERKYWCRVPLKKIPQKIKNRL